MSLFFCFFFFVERTHTHKTLISFSKCSVYFAESWVCCLRSDLYSQKKICHSILIVFMHFTELKYLVVEVSYIPRFFFFNFIFWIMGFLLHGAPIYPEKFDHFCIHFVELRVYYGSCLYIQKKKKKKPKPKTKQKVAFCIIFLFIFLNYGFVVLEWH